MKEERFFFMLQRLLLILTKKKKEVGELGCISLGELQSSQSLPHKVRLWAHEVPYSSPSPQARPPVLK